MSSRTGKWAECGVCGAGVKRKNLEGHVREAHPREYLDEYPDAPAERGIAPCPVCWEWLRVGATDVRSVVARHGLKRYRHSVGAPELDFHIAVEHTGDFSEHCPESCVVCTLGLVHPAWPPDDEDVMDFIFDGDGEYRWESAVEWINQDTGASISAEDLRDHAEAGHAYQFVGDMYEVDEAGRIGTRLHQHLKRPTEIEVEVFEAAEPGETYTFAELAELTGRSKRGLRKREKALTREGILEVADDSRPRTFLATGEHGYDEDTFEVAAEIGDDDPVETGAEPHGGFEERYGHSPEMTGAY